MDLASLWEQSNTAVSNEKALLSFVFFKKQNKTGFFFLNLSVILLSLLTALISIIVINHCRSFYLRFIVLLSSYPRLGLLNVRDKKVI